MLELLDFSHNEIGGRVDLYRSLALWPKNLKYAPKFWPEFQAEFRGY